VCNLSYLGVTRRDKQLCFYTIFLCGERKCPKLRFGHLRARDEKNVWSQSCRSRRGGPRTERLHTYRPHSPSYGDSKMRAVRPPTISGRDRTLGKILHTHRTPGPSGGAPRSRRAEWCTPTARQNPPGGVHGPEIKCCTSTGHLGRVVRAQSPPGEWCTPIARQNPPGEAHGPGNKWCTSTGHLGRVVHAQSPPAEWCTATGRQIPPRGELGP
jgi:hypothetical protein